MARRCEICAAETRNESHRLPTGRVRNLLIGHRLVFLCDTHAQQALDANADSVDALMRLTRVSGDRRSPLDRRSPIDRRVFPPRPEGRRHAGGRRGDDFAN
jgi:hypothetical protein